MKESLVWALWSSVNIKLPAKFFKSFEIAGNGIQTGEILDFRGKCTEFLFEVSFPSQSKFATVHKSRL